MILARIIAATACVFALLPAAPSAAATRDVDIPGRFFQPERIRIHPGDTVVWTNSSREGHSIVATSDSDEQFASSRTCDALLFPSCVDPGERFSHTFDTRGTFDYYCERHGADGMRGRVTVVRKGSGSVVPTASGSASPTATATSPSPSPSPTPDETTLPSATGISTSPLAAPGDDGAGPTSVVAIAAVAVVLLGGSGYLIYRTMIR